MTKSIMFTKSSVANMRHRKRLTALICIICIGSMLVGCQVGYDASWVENPEVDIYYAERSQTETKDESKTIKDSDNKIDCDTYLSDDEQFEKDITNIVIEFLTAFFEYDEDALSILTTIDFFDAMQMYSATEPQNSTWGTFWDTLKLIGIFEIPRKDTLIMATTYTSDFTPEGHFWFVFNLFPTDEALEYPVGASVTIEDSIRRTPDRWNMIITLVYDNERGFLVHDFMHTYDR